MTLHPSFDTDGMLTGYGEYKDETVCFDEIDEDTFPELEEKIQEMERKIKKERASSSPST